MNETLHKAKFKAEWLTDREGREIVLDGYTDGTDWNGWAKPYLTLETMRKLHDAIDAEVMRGTDMVTMTENPDGSFSLWESPTEDTVGISAVETGTEDEQIPLYDMGGQWTWEFADSV